MVENERERESMERRMREELGKEHTRIRLILNSPS